MYTPEQIEEAFDNWEDAASVLSLFAAFKAGADYAATLKAAQGGVTDQTLREMCRAYETTAHGFADFTPNERSLQAMRAALEAALSAEPAAQGEAWPAPPWLPIDQLPESDDLFWFLRGDTVDGPRPPQFGGYDADEWDYFAPCVEPPTERAAQPAQPAERVPLPWPAPFEVVQKWALENGYSSATDDQACAAYRKAHPQPAERVPSRMPYPKLGPEQEACDGYIHECGYADGWNACRDAMLASTAPSEGGKGVEG